MTRHVGMAGGWARLLDDLDGRHALVLPGLAAADRDHLRSAGCALHDRRAGGPSGGYDLVVVAAGRWDRRALTDLVGVLRPGGRLVAAVANPLSPLRRVDLVRSRPGGGARAPGPVRLARHLRACGVAVEQVWGLLRSAVEPVVAVDLAAPRATRAVLAAQRTHVGGSRGLALRAAGALAGRPAVGTLMPARLVVAVRGAPNRPPDRVTGMIGHAGGSEIKIVRGEPPTAVEKYHSHERRADAESTALSVLDAAGLRVAPPLLGRPARDVVRMGWLPGRPCPVRSLTPAELARHVENAAGLLRQVHVATAGSDGSVLVHGDLWLGNVLVDRERAVGIIDWPHAHRGSPAVDRDMLIESLSHVDERTRAELRERCARILGPACGTSGTVRPTPPPDP